MYAAVQSVDLFNTPGAGSVFKGVYKSTHGAAGPWAEVESADQMGQDPTSALSEPNNPYWPTYNPGVQAWYNLYVSIDPTNFRDVVVGLEEVWNTTDGGHTWQSIGRYWDFCNGTSTESWCYAGGPASYPTTHPDQHGAACHQLPSYNAAPAMVPKSDHRREVITQTVVDGNPEVIVKEEVASP